MAVIFDSDVDLYLAKLRLHGTLKIRPRRPSTATHILETYRRVSSSDLRLGAGIFTHLQLGESRSH